VTFTIDGTTEPPVLLNASGVATFPTSALNAGVHTVSADYGGSQTFAPSPATPIQRTVLQSNSMTQLATSPNPAATSQQVTLTATVTAVPVLTPGVVKASGIQATQTQAPPITGVVVFLDGSTRLGMANVDANGHATLPVMFQTPGAHVISAVYGGNPNYAGSPSNTVTQTITAATGDGPRVTLVQRFGYHAMPTTLVVQFNKALDPTSAQNVQNYIIVGPGGVVIPIDLAIYNPLTSSVTLLPRQRLDLHLRYFFVINGTTPAGVRDASGLLLDGAGTGRPGSNYVTFITAANLVVVGDPPGAAAALQLKSRAQSGSLNS
jgi:hypothetical protein